ncbi:MAG: metallophosphoesterase [Lachnospiraceae bacterium]|nr:metallophosphoesterase [Agathobacter sp.]MDD6444336.1 metallophosphoesterase [Lachnospiraceae bacterium]MDY4893215.1 metallophosphoesterase [Agathobacter sp.]
MKILLLSDEESKSIWDFFRKEDYEDIDLVISCGDLKPEYLSFVATMIPVPLLYVHGNHDDKYDSKPPEGCTCIEDQIFEFQGVRILGLGGCLRYKPGKNQYTEQQMQRRISKMFWKIRRKKGFDILVTHAPAQGIHDAEDLCHRGFKAFIDLIEKYHPKYFVHGHVHMNYGRQFPREDMLGDTRVINAFEKYIIEI